MAATTSYTVPANDWTDLGIGPLTVDTVGAQSAWYAVADTKPDAASTGQVPSYFPFAFPNSQHIWARAIGAPNTTAAIVVSPYVSSGAGYTGATATAPGTNGSTATPVQGVDGGKPVGVLDTTLAAALGTSADPSVASGNGTVVSQLKGILAKLAGGLTVTDTATENGIGTSSDPASASGANTTVVGALRAIRDKLLGTVAVSGTFFQVTQPISSADGGQTTLGTTTDAATASGANTTAIGALRAIRDKLLGASGALSQLSGQYRNTSFTDTQTVLGASGTVTNTARFNVAQGTAGIYAYFNATAFADVAGTLFVEGSLDNFASGASTIPENGTAGTALAAGTTVTIKVPYTLPYQRTRYVNGAAAQTKFSIMSSFSGS